MNLLDIPYDVLLLIFNMLNIWGQLALKQTSSHLYTPSILPITCLYNNGLKYNSAKLFTNQIISQFPHLIKLDLRYNKLVNKINLPNLKYLNISWYNHPRNSALTNDELLKLTNLISLKACNSTIVHSLSTLTNLTHLDINRAANNNTLITTHLTKLTYLSLGSQYHSISTLTNLTSLHFDRCVVQPGELNLLTNLTYLDAYCTNINDVSTLVNLEVLDTRSSDIQDISMLTNLEVLDIDDDRLAKYVDHLPKLRTLYVNDEYSNINYKRIPSTLIRHGASHLKYGLITTLRDS